MDRHPGRHRSSPFPSAPRRPDGPKVHRLQRVGECPTYNGRMPTLPPHPSPDPGSDRDGLGDTHQYREVAESFGSEAERYDRARPSYPSELVDRIVEASPGRDFLDVGIGTGIAARQFRKAGCRVLGVDVDDRMAEVARRSGFEVEVSSFEAWDPQVGYSTQ